MVTADGTDAFVLGKRTHRRICGPGRSRGRTRQRQRIRAMSRELVRSGEIPQTPCLLCGSQEGLTIYHIEPLRPDRFVFLCGECHVRAHRHVSYLMSQLLLGDGQADAAIDLLEELYAGSTLRPTSTVNIGMALRTRESNDAVDLAVENDLAYLLAAHRPDRLDDAYRIANQVAGISNFSAPILDTLGWIEHLRGNETRALKTLCRAVAIANAEPQIHEHLAAVYNALGNDTWSRYHSAASSRDRSVRP